MKKIAFFLILLILIQSCGFTPVYVSNERVNFNIESVTYEGDQELNNYIKIRLKKYNSKNSNNTKFKISAKTNYTKKAQSKDSKGNIQSFKVESSVTFLITGNKSKKGYLDTVDNFREVIINEGTLNQKKTIVSKNLLEGRYKLFTSHLHVERVINAIKLLKLGSPNEIFCTYARESKRLPLRLIHYKYPTLRYLYEFFATIYQGIKVYFSKIFFINWLRKR